MKSYNRIEIEKDSAITEFLLSLPISDKTKEGYINWLKLYSNYTGKAPVDLIDEAEDEEDNGIKMRRRKIKKYLNGVARLLDEKDYSPLSVGRIISGIKTFYKYYDITTPKINLRPKNQTTYKDLPTIKEIKKVVRSASTRDKSLILTHLSSGMGASEARHLKYADFLKGIGAPKDTLIEDLHNFVTKKTVPIFTIKRTKMNKYEFSTFCSPEATQAIVDYLEERNKESVWLFTGKGIEQIAERTYSGIFERLNDKNKLGFKESGTARRFTPHQLRRLFASNLLGKGVNKEYIDHFLGHRQSSVSESYFKVQKDVLRKAYISGLDSITLNPVKIVEFGDEETEKMKERLAMMEKKMELQEKVIQQINELNKI